MKKNIYDTQLISAVKQAESKSDFPYGDIYRQHFHLMPKVGWLNDPNGLCQINGKYHIFYQYSPFDTKPGINYWGHYSTENFVDYNSHSPAICASEKFDCHGVYSGSAVWNKEQNELYAFYTGNVKECGDYDYINSGREQNTIMAKAKIDEKSDENLFFENKKVIMTNSDYPNDESCHVRDPKIFKFDKKNYMLLGARRKNDIGEALLYESDNLTDWKISNRFTTKEKFGYMWECPDIVFLEDKTFLLVCPQGVNKNGYLYNNIYQSGYFEIDGDFRNNNKPLEDFFEFDCGFDFYAPQTFTDEFNRCIMIGWMGLPDSPYECLTKEYGWVHTLTIPRELYLKDGKLHQKPLEEFKKLRGNRITNFQKAHLNAPLEILIAKNTSDDFSINIFKDCKIEFKNNLFSLSFGKSGCGRDIRSTILKEVYKLRIFVDKSSIEIFINDGEKVFTSRFFPKINEKSIGIFGIDAGVIKAWELNSFSY